MSFPQHERIAKLITEFAGTMFLCLTIALTAGTTPFAAIAIGCMLMLLVYSGGHVSGAHYNPAVTLAVLIRGDGKISVIDAVLYVLVQLAGGISGALLSWPLVTKELAGHAALGSGVSLGSAFIVEFMLTLALCSVVLHTATTKAQANNSYYGLAIGFTVLSGAISVGGISGGAFNPAVGLMSALYGGDSAKNCWIYFVGPLLAAIVAGLFFRICAAGEYSDTPNPALTRLAPAAVEAFGTMMLCFTVGTAARGGVLLNQLSIGSILMCMIYMGGSISGGHYNPAVTLAVLLRTAFGATHDQFSWKQALAYVPSQVLGAALGTFAAWAALDGNANVGYPTLPSSSNYGQGILGEALGTFLLACTVLNVATVNQLKGNSFFGLAIGMVVTCMAFGIGPITGGAFNPAVGLIGVFSGGARVAIETVWIYWVACPLGAALAALFFRVQNFEEFHTDLSLAKFTAHATHDQPEKQKFMCHSHVNESKKWDMHLAKAEAASQELPNAEAVSGVGPKEEAAGVAEV